MENNLNNIWFWAKVAGMCQSIVNGRQDDGKVWLSEDEVGMLKTLADIKPWDAVNLCRGWEL